MLFLQTARILYADYADKKKVTMRDYAMQARGYTSTLESLIAIIALTCRNDAAQLAFADFY